MEIIRVVNTVGVDYMVDVVVPPEGMNKESFLGALKNALQENRENIFILQAYEGSDLIGLLLAVSLPDQNHVFVYQAWSDDKRMTTHAVRKMFMRLVLWADAKGKTELRVEVKEGAEDFYQKWGFVEHTKILKFEVAEGFEDKLLESLLKEPDDGRIQSKQTERKEYPLGSSERHIEHTEEPNSGGTGRDSEESVEGEVLEKSVS